MNTHVAIFESVPDGATGTRESIDEAGASLRAGLGVWIEMERELGRQIPVPSTLRTRTISTDAA
jgi:predicted RNase H-like HicB family nuclease